jgi:hypothetical protein
MTIREQLMETTGIKPKAKEDDSAFRARLARKVDENDFSEDDWKALDETKGTQKWCNTANDELDAGREAPPFPDDPPEEEEAAEETAEEETDTGGDDLQEDNVEAQTETTPKKAAGAGKVPAKAKPVGGERKKREGDSINKAAGAGKVPAKAKPVGGERKKREGDSINKAVMRHMLKKPKDKSDAITVALANKGMEASERTVMWTRSTFRTCCELLDEEGLLKGGNPFAAD